MYNLYMRIVQQQERKLLIRRFIVRFALPTLIRMRVPTLIRMRVPILIRMRV